MKEEMANRVCPECGYPILGRTGKVFCSDGCRTRFNNNRRKDANQIMRKVNHILRTNRSILEECINRGLETVRKPDLLEMGFDFDHCTATGISSTGMAFRYCYEFGYTLLDGDLVGLVKKNGNSFI